MSKVLLHLRNVPDEEADGVRAFLDAHRIAWYQTRPGPLGITGGAIWIKHDQDYPQARRLMDTYQQELRERVRAGLADGTIDTVGTDHAPHPAETKQCEWTVAAMGMTGLETALSVVQQAMVDTGLMDWAGVARVMSTAPARIAGLTDQGQADERGFLPPTEPRCQVEYGVFTGEGECGIDEAGVEPKGQHFCPVGGDDGRRLPDGDGWFVWGSGADV